MRNALFTLGLLAVVSIGAWRLLTPALTPRDPGERTKAASPMESVRKPQPASATPIERPIAGQVVDIIGEAKAAAARALMEERFSDLKEEGRRVRQTLMESDPKAAQAYNEVIRRPEYRALLDRRHQIEAAWTTAPENEREGMLKEMNSLRQQGFALILGEIQRLQSQPAAPAPAAAATPAQTTSAPAGPTPAPAPPVVFQ